jgi:cytochrome c5
MRPNASARHLTSRVVPALIACLTSGIAAADTARQGEQVYEEVCAACHGRGVPARHNWATGASGRR